MNRYEEELLHLERLCGKVIIRIETNEEIKQQIMENKPLKEAYVNLTDHLNVE